MSSFVFWLYTRSSLFAAILYVSLFMNSVLLAYLDIYFAPSLILSLWALEKNRITLFTLTFMISCLIKWQIFIISPFILLYILNINSVNEWSQIDLKSLISRVFVPLTLILVCASLIFGFGEILGAFKNTVKMHNYLSGKALNFNWMITYLLHIVDPQQFGGLTNEPWAMVIRTDQLKITLLPRIIFVVVYSTILLKFFRTKKTFENLLLYSIIGYLAYFLFNFSVHENHLFLIVILSLLLLRLNAEHLMLAVVIFFMNNVNLWIFNGFDGTVPGLNRGIWPVSFILSFLNLVLFTILISKYFFHFNILSKLKNSIIYK